MSVFLNSLIYRLFTIVFIFGAYSQLALGNPSESGQRKLKGSLNLNLLECQALSRNSELLKKIYLEFVNGIPMQYEKNDGKIQKGFISDDFTKAEQETFYVDFLDKYLNVYEPDDSKQLQVYIEKFDEVTPIFNTETSSASVKAVMELSQKEMRRSLNSVLNSKNVTVNKSARTFELNIRSGFFYLTDMFLVNDIDEHLKLDIRLPVLAGWCDMNTAKSKTLNIKDAEKNLDSKTQEPTYRKTEFLATKKNYEYKCDTNLEIIKSYIFRYKNMLTPEATIDWYDGKTENLLEYSVGSEFIPKNMIDSFNYFSMQDLIKEDPVLSSQGYFLFNQRRQSDPHNTSIIFQDYFKDSHLLYSGDKEIKMRMKEESDQSIHLEGQYEGYDFKGTCTRNEIETLGFEKTFEEFQAGISFLVKDILKASMLDRMEETPIPYVQDGPPF